MVLAVTTDALPMQLIGGYPHGGMMLPLNQKNMQTLMQAAEKLNNPTLSSKIRWLQGHKSKDPLQQMQSDAIVDLYAAVKQIQLAIWPMLALIPDVGAVKDAAGQAGAKNTLTPASPLTVNKAPLLTKVKLR